MSFIQDNKHKERTSRYILFSIFSLLLFTLPAYTGLAIVSLFTHILIYGLLVMSMDLLAGYCGLLVFNQAAIFGAAAYTSAVLIKHFNITNFFVSALASVVMAMLISCIFSLIALRVKGMYFLLITLALGELFYAVVSNNSIPTLLRLLGGSDGIGGIPYPNLHGFSFSPVSYYYFVLVVFIFTSFLLYRIIISPFGYSLQGIRENETRALALGYNIWLHRFIACIISGIFAGIAGVLYVHFNGFISPKTVGIEGSALLWLMLILGGAGKLWGGLVGCAIVLTLRYLIIGYTPERWPLFLGIGFVVVIMFFREGVFSYLTNLWKKGINYGSIKS